MYLLPRPQEISLKDGYYTISFNHKIVIDCSCESDVYDYACLLQEDLKKYGGYGIAVTRGYSKKTAVILAMDSRMEDEEYRLHVGEEGIRIEGGTSKGILYGVQTLRQMVRQAGVCIPFADIHDFPGIANRGFYYDVTRGRIPTLSYLKGLADKMAFYKMNQLQLYIEHTFLFEGLSETWRDDTPLTPQDILELDAYCRKLNIELAPSLSSFGHLYKILRTKSYEHLCELDEPRNEPFGFIDRMHHHTIDVTNEESLPFIKGLIEEFLPLFTSKHFNICADETFDLGKGKSREAADKAGVKRLYLDYIKDLCEFILSKGKIPMFWGDIICGFPEAVKELPEQTICLNWGYDKYQSDESTKKLAAAGATQYSCPGVSGWNQFVNQLDVAYENIKRMCSYAFAYQTDGVLTTSWGDCGQINHPDFGIAGMIYGAAFSWNQDIPDFDEINRQISRVEFGDKSESLVSVAAQIPNNWIFKWWDAVNYMEKNGKAFTREELEGTGEALSGLEDIARKLCQIIPQLSSDVTPIIHSYLIGIKGMELFQKIGVLLSAKDYGQEPILPIDAGSLAEELEEWFMFYKEDWRLTGRESELYRIQNVIFWYADLLRSL